MKNDEAFELMIGHEIYYFASHADVVGAVAAMMRGTHVSGVADPSNKKCRVALQPIEARVQRRELPAPMARAVSQIAAGMPGPRRALEAGPGYLSTTNFCPYCGKELPE